MDSAPVSPQDEHGQENSHAIVSGGSLLRRLPHNVDAEAAVLGAILVNNKAHQKVSLILSAEHFVLVEHALIYAQVCQIIGEGRVADPVTLKAWAESCKEMANVGGAGYLMRLAHAAVSAASAADYAAVIRGLATRRALISIGEEIVDRAYADDLGAEEQVEAAESGLSGLHRESLGAWVSIGDAATKAMIRCERIMKGEVPPGLPTGLLDLDAITGGLHPQQLVVLAGRPGMGKSAMAMGWATKAAKSGTPTAAFSLEMSEEQLGTRALSAAARMSGQEIALGRIDPNDFLELNSAARALGALPLWINDGANATVQRVKAEARRLKSQKKIGLLVVDYLQLMQSGDRYSGNRVAEVGEISRALKGIAKELNIPVVALCQLSRAVEQRDDKRPRLADLRESGTIEQDADVVIGIFRQEVYLRADEPEPGTPEHDTWQEMVDRYRGIAEAIVLKNRTGPCGTAPIFFDAKTTSFGNLDKNHG